MLFSNAVFSKVKIPVVAVGGMANGRSLAAALTLGAQGVMMASRFIATRECLAHENIKQELVKRQEFETTIFGRSIGLQGRALKNKVIDEILAIEARGGGLQELIPLLAGDRIKNAWEKGEVAEAPLMVGQSIGLIKNVMSCKELLENMVREAEENLRRVNRLIQA